MPYVNVKVTNDGLTREKKAEIVARITQTLGDVLGKKPELTHIVIDAVEDEDWGYAGLLTDEWRDRSN